MKPPRIMPPVYLLLAIIAMVALAYSFPQPELLTGPWRWAGTVPIVAGVGLAVWVVRLFHKRGTTIRPGAVSNDLLTDGPFRFSRNPIYLGMTCLLVGIALALGSLTPWPIVPIFVALVAWNVIPVEESMLEEAFPDEYARYRARVRRWI